MTGAPAQPDSSQQDPFKQTKPNRNLVTPTLVTAADAHRDQIMRRRAAVSWPMGSTSTADGAVGMGATDDSAEPLGGLAGDGLRVVLLAQPATG
jgi:hypothetical protein